MWIQKVFSIHDWLYASQDQIPQRSFDGKDTLDTRYIVTPEPMKTEAHANDYPNFNSRDEAQRYADDSDNWGNHWGWK